ncbi:hypothetical protein POTOM_049685 [Populus tomentosa]|uniref:Uncharacterized protein n=1 Tax=Populus tomentosa TaxID=118781 RepID=A0A8X8C9C7_POPTO|nr:hypothetical protein POTOM_049685 [Populus tomentosa]
MTTLILDNNLNDVSPQFSTKNIKEEEEYRGAIDRYLRGNADMSLLSSNEEVKELKRMVADKDEELERKERELEHLSNATHKLAQCFQILLMVEPDSIVHVSGASYPALVFWFELPVGSSRIEVRE